MLLNTFEMKHSQNPTLLSQTCVYFKNAPFVRGYITCKKLVDFFTMYVEEGTLNCSLKLQMDFSGRQSYKRFPHKTPIMLCLQIHYNYLVKFLCEG